MNLVNLTPHPIVICKDGEIIETLPSSGSARVDVTENQVGNLEVNGTLVPLITQVFSSEVTGLPAPQPLTTYIVSSIVLQACPERDDLVVPTRPVRDEEGHIVGCEAFAR